MRLLPAVSLLVAPLAWLALAACSTDGGTGPDPQPEPTRIELSESSITLYKGATKQVTATVKGGQPGAQVSWSSADTLITTVDSTGLVRGRSPGQTTVTAATDAARSTVSVTINDDRTAPTLTKITASPDPLNVSSETRITFSIQASDAQAGVRAAAAMISSPSGIGSTGAGLWCDSTKPASGTVQDGTWQCSFTFNRYMEPGVWQVGTRVADAASNNTQRSAVTTFTVTGSSEDASPPTLTGISIASEKVTFLNGKEYRRVSLAVSDTEAGVFEARVKFVDESGAPVTNCTTTPTRDSAEEWSARNSATMVCSIAVQQVSSPTYWIIQEVTVGDLRGNARA